MGTIRRLVVGGFAVLLLALLASGSPAAARAEGPEFGVCRHVGKKGLYAEANCEEQLEKRKGAYEWLPGPPRECLPMKKGEYTDAACTTKAKKLHKGHYEKSYGDSFETSGLGRAVLLEITETRSIACSGSNVAGSILSATEISTTFQLSGCELAPHTGYKCQGQGDTEGTLPQADVTQELVETLGGEGVATRWRTYPPTVFDGGGGYIECNSPVPIRLRISPLTEPVGIFFGDVSSTTLEEAWREHTPGELRSRGEEWNGTEWTSPCVGGCLAEMYGVFEFGFKGPVEIKAPGL